MALWKLPDAHATQELATEPENMPAAHAPQEDDACAPTAVENMPEAQLTHAVEPAPAW